MRIVRGLRSEAVLLWMLAFLFFLRVLGEALVAFLGSGIRD